MSYSPYYYHKIRKLYKGSKRQQFLIDLEESVQKGVCTKLQHPETEHLVSYTIDKPRACDADGVSAVCDYIVVDKNRREVVAVSIPRYYTFEESQELPEAYALDQKCLDDIENWDIYKEYDGVRATLFWNEYLDRWDLVEKGGFDTPVIQHALKRINEEISRNDTIAQGMLYKSNHDKNFIFDIINPHHKDGVVDYGGRDSANLIAIFNIVDFSDITNQRYRDYKSWIASNYILVPDKLSTHDSLSYCIDPENILDSLQCMQREVDRKSVEHYRGALIRLPNTQLFSLRSTDYKDMKCLKDQFKRADVLKFISDNGIEAALKKRNSFLESLDERLHIDYWRICKDFESCLKDVRKEVENLIRVNSHLSNKELGMYLGRRNGTFSESLLFDYRKSEGEIFSHNHKTGQRIYKHIAQQIK